MNRIRMSSTDCNFVDLLRNTFERWSWFVRLLNGVELLKTMSESQFNVMMMAMMMKEMELPFTLAKNDGYAVDHRWRKLKLCKFVTVMHRVLSWERERESEKDWSQFLHNLISKWLGDSFTPLHSLCLLWQIIQIGMEAHDNHSFTHRRKWVRERREDSILHIRAMMGRLGSGSRRWAEDDDEDEKWRKWLGLNHCWCGWWALKLAKCSGVTLQH